MEFLPSRVEAQIGTELTLPLAVYGKHGNERKAFNLCEGMPLSVHVLETAIFKHIEGLLRFYLLVQKTYSFQVV